MAGPLAQSAERGADNAKVVSSTLTRTNQRAFFLLLNILSADKSFFKISFSILTSWLVFTYIRATCFKSLTPRTQQWCPRGHEIKLQD